MTEAEIEVVVTQILLTGVITADTSGVNDGDYVHEYVVSGSIGEEWAGKILDRLWDIVGGAADD